MSFKELFVNEEYSQCKGCSVLNKSLPFHCNIDNPTKSDIDILFVVDSYKFNGFKPEIYSHDDEVFLFQQIPEIKNLSYAFTPSVKCPSIKEADMNAGNRDICRKYIQQTIADYNPKLIILCGNLAFQMVMKKSGIAKHHGSEFEYNGIPVIPTYSLAIRYVEPRYNDVIKQDIQLGINKIITKVTKPLNLDYKVIKNEDDLGVFIYDNNLHLTQSPIAIDIETTGLNHITDKILTVAMCFKGKDDAPVTFCTTVYHKESEVKDYDKLFKLINFITSNSNNKKVLQNAKFDMRMLMRHGVRFVNVWDTKGMAHRLDEYGQGSLLSLVKTYMPENLETL